MKTQEKSFETVIFNKLKIQSTYQSVQNAV